MAQETENRVIPYLPTDIIRNIVKRLSVKSLLQFQSVSKTWRNVILSKSFIAEHLDHSNQNISLLMEPFPFNLNLRLVDCRLQVHNVSNPFQKNSFDCAWIVGSCNGLLCAQINRDYFHSLLLWNLASRAYMFVPSRGSSGNVGSVVGFGFCSIASDYKIVRIYKSKNAVVRAEVFLLSIESWKEIDIANLKGVDVHTETVANNGSIYWSAAKVEDDKEVAEPTNVIVSFDIKNELFTLIRMPGFTRTGMLAVCEDKLAIIHNIWHENDGEYMIDLWVMEKGGLGERQSWTKTSIVNPFEFKLTPKTIWKNEIVCEAEAPPEEINREEKYIFYLLNIKTGEAKTFQVAKFGRFVCMWNYVDSLVCPSA